VVDHAAGYWVERLHGCLARLLPHTDARRIALTGSVAIDFHLAAGTRPLPRRPAADVDLVAADRHVVRSSVAADFLVSHFHAPQSGYPKFLIQLVDPVSRIRVDVFPDAATSLARAQLGEVAGVPVQVLDALSILEHKLATLGSASTVRPIDEKHWRDAVVLGALCNRDIPPLTPAWMGKDVYSQDLEAECARCAASRDAAFPLAAKRAICDVLGYV